MVFFFGRKLVNIEFFLEIINGAEAVNVPLIMIFTAGYDVLWVRLVNDVFTDKLKENVTQGNKAYDTAVFIHYHSFLMTCFAELL